MIYFIYLFLPVHILLVKYFLSLTDSVSLPVLQLLSIGPPGHLVSPVQQGPAGVHSPGLRPSNTCGPSHPLIHLKELSAFFFFYFIIIFLKSLILFPLHLPRFLRSEFLWFILDWQDEQDEYFLTAFHCQFINFLE